MSPPGPIAHPSDGAAERRQTAVLRRVAGALAMLVGGLLAASVGWLWWDSRLPSTYSVMAHGDLDAGGGALGHGHAGHVSVARLTERATGPADVRLTLTATERELRLPSGRRVDALTFDGGAPGPELRVRQGDLVEVTLRNRDVDAGVSVHWHGLDVPNAADGVSGVTQDAVLPGGRHVYRFRAEQAGTYWYHSHQHSSNQVRRGLYGAVVVLPRTAGEGGLDLTVMSHTFPGARVLNATDGLERHRVRAGTPVRLRLVNTDDTPTRFSLAGTPFRVVAIDGTDLHRPQPIVRRTLAVAAGGRYDVAFTMPATPVTLGVVGARTGLVLSRNGRDGRLPPAAEPPLFDPAGYGRPRAQALAQGPYHRDFRLEIGRRLGFVDGRPGLHWTINGRLYPDVPTFAVRPGDRVRVTIANDTRDDHPMHLHGHHLLVLSRDGRPVRGSPWWVDTLNVLPGEEYELAFRAGNRGLWMLHCHNLGHAAAGLTMHVAYEGVRTPYRVGGRARNRPE